MSSLLGDVGARLIPFVKCEARAIDRYVEERTRDQGRIDTKLQAIIESILERCIQEGEYKQVRTLLASHIFTIINMKWHAH